jgi:hypothetical protein
MGKGRAIVGLRVDSRLMMNRWMVAGAGGGRASERGGVIYTPNNRNRILLCPFLVSYIINTLYPFDLYLTFATFDPYNTPSRHCYHLLGLR